MKPTRDRRGRPPLTEGDTPARVHITLPSKDYDRVDSIAKRDGVSIPAVIRRGVARVLEDVDDEE